MTDASFEHTSTVVLAEGRLLRLEELRALSPAGEEVVREVVRHPGGVAVLPIDGDRVWLIRQYRVAMGRAMAEIPAGKLDRAGEEPEAAARRELREELGAQAGRLEHLATMAPSPGYTDEVLEIYAAQDLDFAQRSPDGEEERQASVFSMPIAEAVDSIGRGELIDAKTQVAVLQWMRRRG